MPEPRSSVRIAPRSLAEILVDRLDVARGAIEELIDEGYSVLGLDLLGACEPVVTIEPASRLGALIEAGSACYYRRGPDGDGHFERRGQFKRAGCRIIWIERGH